MRAWKTASPTWVWWATRSQSAVSVKSPPAQISASWSRVAPAISVSPASGSMNRSGQGASKRSTVAAACGADRGVAPTEGASKGPVRGLSTPGSPHPSARALATTTVEIVRMRRIRLLIIEYLLPKAVQSERAEVPLWSPLERAVHQGLAHGDESAACQGLDAGVVSLVGLIPTSRRLTGASCSG